MASIGDPGEPAGAPELASETRAAPDEVREVGLKERRSAAASLVDLANAVELFHTPGGDPFATIELAGHHETQPVRSNAFAGWLRRSYWSAYREPAPASSMADAIATLAARADFDGETQPVALRIAAHDHRIYLDLANAAWQAVEIDARGWRVVDDPPVKFRRSTTMAGLPIPVRGGSIELLRPFLNLADDDAWHLFVGYLLAAFRPTPPYLVLVLYGEQGSAKSTTTRIIRALLDPGQSPLRSEPKEQQDLLIAARNNWVVAFDNLSHLPGWLSDAVCRLSTGGGLGKRQLYTDQDEIVLDAQRPQVLNGITEFVTRGDLLDRSIIQEQPTIIDGARRAEATFWADFEAVRPLILGALLDAVSAAHAGESDVVLDDLPRMADPTKWVTAAERALDWPTGTFAAAYRRNRHEGSALALDAALIAAPLIELIEEQEFEGSASDMLAKLGMLVSEDVVRGRDWPKNPRALTAALKRLAPDLRKSGIEWRPLERKGSIRLHSVRRVPTVTTVTSVTASTSTDDGHDGHDGRLPDAGPVQQDLLAMAMRVFGDDIADIYVLGTA
jgi:hypothetical protein